MGGESYDLRVLGKGEVMRWLSTTICVLAGMLVLLSSAGISSKERSCVDTCKSVNTDCLGSIEKWHETCVAKGRRKTTCDKRKEMVAIRCNARRERCEESCERKAKAAFSKKKKKKTARRRATPSGSSRPTVKLIPNTGIENTKDNRAVVATIEAYRQAMLRRDASAIAKLVHPAYHDDAGTAAPHDDIDRKQLLRILRSHLQSLKEVAYNIVYRKMSWNKPTQAEVDATISAIYELSLPGGGTRVVRHKDDNRFVLKRQRGRWLFLRGM